MVILKIKTLHSTHKKTEKAIIIGVQLQGQALHIDEYLDELEQLARTSGAEPKKRFIQNLDHPNPKTYVGTGKIADIA